MLLRRRDPFRDTCERHRDALIDFVDHAAAGDQVRAALDHLARCRDCERELGTTALIITALRRMFVEASATAPTSDAWLGLRARVSGRRAWSPGPITALLTGSALVLTLLMPGLGGWRPATSVIIDDGSPSPAPSSAPSSAAAALEVAQDPTPVAPEVHSTPPLRSPALVAEGAERKESAPRFTGGGSVPSHYPDNVRPASGPNLAGPPVHPR